MTLARLLRYHRLPNDRYPAPVELLQPVATPQEQTQAALRRLDSLDCGTFLTHA